MKRIFEILKNALGLEYESDLRFCKDKKNTFSVVEKLKESGELTDDDVEMLYEYFEMTSFQ